MPQEIGTCLTYFIGHFSQLFIYCYLGTQLIEEVILSLITDINDKLSLIDIHQLLICRVRLYQVWYFIVDGIYREIQPD